MLTKNLVSRPLYPKRTRHEAVRMILYWSLTSSLMRFAPISIRGIHPKIPMPSACGGHGQCHRWNGRRARNSASHSPATWFPTRPHCADAKRAHPRVIEEWIHCFLPILPAAKRGERTSGKPLAPSPLLPEPPAQGAGESTARRHWRPQRPAWGTPNGENGRIGRGWHVS